MYSEVYLSVKKKNSPRVSIQHTHACQSNTHTHVSIQHTRACQSNTHTRVNPTHTHVSIQHTRACHFTMARVLIKRSRLTNIPSRDKLTPQNKWSEFAMSFPNKFWVLMVSPERSNSDLSEYTLFHIILFYFYKSISR